MGFPEPDSKPEEHHIRILNAVGRIDMVVRQVLRLLDRIESGSRKGYEEAKAEIAKGPGPEDLTLKKCLETTADEINKKVDIILDDVNRIENILFNI